LNIYITAAVTVLCYCYSYGTVLVTVFVKVKVKVGLEQATKAHRRSNSIALLFFLTSVPDRGGWSTPRPGRFTPGKDPIPILY